LSPERGRHIALIFLVRGNLDGSTADFGLVQACFGVGMLVPSLGLGALRRPPAPRGLLLRSCLIGAAGACLTGVAPSIGVAAGGQLLAGVGNGADNIAIAGLVQTLVPAQLLGRVFGVIVTAVQLGSALAYGVSGPAIALSSAPIVFVAGGLGSLIALPVLAFGLPEAELRAGDQRRGALSSRP
jgi:MFS family permease